MTESTDFPPPFFGSGTIEGDSPAPEIARAQPRRSRYPFINLHQRIFVVVDEPYHENGEVIGVTDSLESARSLCMPPSGRPFDDGRYSIYEYTLNGDRVRWMSNAFSSDTIEDLEFDWEPK